MAFLTRQLCRACLLSTSDCSVLGRRYLFSNEILGIENFKRISICEKDKLTYRVGLVEKLDHSLNVQKNWNKYVIHDFVKLIYITDKLHGVPLIIRRLRQLYCGSKATVESSLCDEHEESISEGPLSPRQFHLGPLVFRLLHILKDTDTAQLLYEDKELRPLFLSTTCHLLLMDMLYEAGHYQDVINTFTALQHAEALVKFSPYCTTLAMGALYQMNTKESYCAMKRLGKEAKIGHQNLSRRSILFAAALALRQAPILWSSLSAFLRHCDSVSSSKSSLKNFLFTSSNAKFQQFILGDAAFALDATRSVLNSSESTFRNIKLIALAQLDHVEEAVMTLEDELSLQLSASSPSFSLYSDTVQSLADHVHVTSKSKPELKDKFEHLMSFLESEGFLSPQTVEHFVCRPILKQRKPKVSQSFKTKLKSPVKIK